MPFRSLERGWRRGATRSSYRGRDQAGATDVILDIKRLLLSPGNTSILPENIVGQSLSVGFRPLPQTTPVIKEFLNTSGMESLPVTLLDGQLVMAGKLPTREDIARWSGIPLTQDWSEDSTQPRCCSIPRMP
ncbi:arsenic metallochaperone ArsD family protein [Salmonella enterica]|nr:arsenic metallochaperone ArsD family protein [Escherichia coli]EFN8571861.1 arsenical resistance operon transcriptional repressor ArsD [Escherichia coli O85:H32]EHJ3515427.1 arsenic metallochaperone ArsD family protein [Salmonella enterica]TXB24238.1 arsenic metallochaperone ArsD family protein [Salmonella enterica subsp. enterica serovar Infantis]EFN0170554.1 arsenic metallochaperone ArsD family protein [Escherichia coli]